MLEWFKCSDGEVTKASDCLKNCRMGERCLTLPTLEWIGKERVWDGIASTTQLLNGTMYSFLKLTQPYVVDPDDMAFALLGSIHHDKMRDMAKELGLPAEIALTTEDRDIFDLLEPDNDGYILTDYKTWGSFKVAQAIGMVKTGQRPDPSGEVYKRSGAWGKAGTPKMVPVFRAMPGEAENTDAELQLNRYRIMIEEKGLIINRMRVQVTVRDGELAVARSRGIEKNLMMIPIKRLADDDVRDYFDMKATQLTTALEDGRCSIPCSNHECWDGVRCRSYCEVAMYCPKGLLEIGGAH